jgi:dihydrofolate synthase/folylpolyglutamate synthase
MNKNIESWVFAHYGSEFYHPGLERIKAALSSIKDDLASSKIVIIAGTNGKGETTHRLAELLAEDRFCAWTSPHIHSVCERFSSNSGNISEEELCDLVRTTHERVQKNNYQLSYYEFLFFVFCRWSVKLKPDYLLLEVGLGGRLDAVNSFDADIVLLTSISRDHQEFLGHRYDQILMEKLGVVRKKSKLFTYFDLNYLKAKTAFFSKGLECTHFDLNESFETPVYAFSLRNQILAYAAFCELKKLPLTPSGWIPSKTDLFGRGEIIKSDHEWWLYGSHNVDGMRKLIQFLKSKNYNLTEKPFDLILTSFSKRNETDLRVMLKMLKGSQLGKVVVTSFDHPKAYPAFELKEKALQEGLNFVENISEIVQGRTNQKILVVGSYYFLGIIKSLFRI